MQPNGSRHIHSNEAGLRSSQEVRPQVRVNSVAHVGSKGKRGSLNTAPELLLEAPVRLHAVQSARLARGATSGLTLQLSPRNRGVAADPFGVIRECSLAVWKGASRPPAISTKKSFHWYILVIPYWKYLPQQTLHHISYICIIILAQISLLLSQSHINFHLLYHLSHPCLTGENLVLNP